MLKWLNLNWIAQTSTHLKCQTYFFTQSLLNRKFWHRIWLEEKRAHRLSFLTWSRICSHMRKDTWTHLRQFSQPRSFPCTHKNNSMSSHTVQANILPSASETNMFLFRCYAVEKIQASVQMTTSMIWLLWWFGKCRYLVSGSVTSVSHRQDSRCVLASALSGFISVLICPQSGTLAPPIPKCDNRRGGGGGQLERQKVDRSCPEFMCMCVWAGLYMQIEQIKNKSLGIFHPPKSVKNKNMGKVFIRRCHGDSWKHQERKACQYQSVGSIPSDMYGLPKQNR